MGNEVEVVPRADGLLRPAIDQTLLAQMDDTSRAIVTGKRIGSPAEVARTLALVAQLRSLARLVAADTGAPLTPAEQLAGVIAGRTLAPLLDAPPPLAMVPLENDPIAALLGKAKGCQAEDGE